MLVSEKRSEDEKKRRERRREKKWAMRGKNRKESQMTR